MSNTYTGPERRATPYITDDIAIKVQKWAVGGLLTIIIALIGWVYSYGQFVLKVDQVEDIVQELHDDLYNLDARITDMLITRMDERFRRSDWEREENKLDKRFENLQIEINRLHKEINRMMDKLDEVFLTEERRLSP